MKKVTTLVLMLFLVLSGALCYAHGAVGTEKEKGDGAPLIAIIKAQYGGVDKSGSIQAYCDGHYLTVAFLENLGQVSVEITTATGNRVEFMSITTPNGYQYYIANTGDYIVTFTLEHGDEYYGEFSVE